VPRAHQQAEQQAPGGRVATKHGTGGQRRHRILLMAKRQRQGDRKGPRDVAAEAQRGGVPGQIGRGMPRRHQPVARRQRGVREECGLFKGLGDFRPFPDRESRTGEELGGIDHPGIAMGQRGLRPGGGDQRHDVAMDREQRRDPRRAGKVARIRRLLPPFGEVRQSPAGRPVEIAALVLPDPLRPGPPIGRPRGERAAVLGKRS